MEVLSSLLFLFITTSSISTRNLRSPLSTLRRVVNTSVELHTSLPLLISDSREMTWMFSFRSPHQTPFFPSQPKCDTEHTRQNYTEQTTNCKTIQISPHKKLCHLDSLPKCCCNYILVFIFYFELNISIPSIAHLVTIAHHKS